MAVGVVTWDSETAIDRGESFLTSSLNAPSNGGSSSLVGLSRLLGEFRPLVLGDDVSLPCLDTGGLASWLSASCEPKLLILKLLSAPRDVGENGTSSASVFVVAKLAVVTCSGYISV